MDRYLVPRLGLVVVISLATLLIGVIVLRSPDTHSNLWASVNPTYTRTDLAAIDGTVQHAPRDLEFALAHLGAATAGTTVADPGRRAFLAAGCGTCHGLDAQGGAVGPSLAGASLETVNHMVRDGPGGMPAYGPTQLTDTDLASLAAYLQGLALPRPNSSEIAAIQNLTWDPAIPLALVLQGKAAVRRSCGACHAQPTKETIRHAFGSDFDATSLVAGMIPNTNLSLEDARAIAYYMLAILNGADPVREP